MNAFENTYLNLLQAVWNNGTNKKDRTGVGIRSIFGGMMQFDLSGGLFPLLTTKRVAWKAVATELLWFISGDTNIRRLVLAGCNIWNEWPFVAWLKKTQQAVPKQGSPGWISLMEEFLNQIKNNEVFAALRGDLGAVYGKQWRSWPAGGEQTPIDQLSNVINQIQTNPDSRRLIVSAWNPTEIPEMLLPPCHYSFQFDVTDGKLSLLINQRSADMFLGVPFNIASYALLLLMVAQVTSLKPGKLVWSGGNIHIYDNHFAAVEEQLKRKPRKAPKVKLNPSVKRLFDFRPEHIILDGYDPHSAIPAPVAV